MNINDIYNNNNSYVILLTALEALADNIDYMKKNMDKKIHLLKINDISYEILQTFVQQTLFIDKNTQKIFVADVEYISINLSSASICNNVKYFDNAENVIQKWIKTIKEII